jgi:hypothetical protein
MRASTLFAASNTNIQVNEAAMEALIEQCRSDIRLVVNTLQVLINCLCLIVISRMLTPHLSPDAPLER